MPEGLRAVVDYHDFHIWIPLLDAVSDITYPVAQPVQTNELHLYCQHAERALKT
jgi:hypothetical protein